jgi:hypothetical protein
MTKAEKIQQILNFIFYNSINRILRLFNYNIHAQVVLKFNSTDFESYPDYFEITFNKLVPTKNKNISLVILQKQLFKINL